MKDTMKGLVFLGDGKYEIKQVPFPKIKRANEVILKIEACSICGTDVHILDVPPGHPANVGTILGHEMVGEIVEVGLGVKNYTIGERVSLDPNLFCGDCFFCKKGQTNMCENNTCLGIFLDGGFSEYCVVPDNALIRLPKDMPIERAVFIEPLAGVVNAVRKLNVKVGETAVILGAGPIGLYFVQMLKASGVRKILVVELSEYRKNFALKLGADIVIDSTRDNVKKAILKETIFGADMVIDCVGTLLKDATDYVRNGGRILLFGINWSKEQTLNQAVITRKDITVYGNYVSSFMYQDTVDIIASELLPLEKMITHKLSLDDIQQGLDDMKKGTALEVIIYPGGVR